MLNVEDKSSIQHSEFSIQHCLPFASSGDGPPVRNGFRPLFREFFINPKHKVTLIPSEVHNEQL